MQFGYPGNVSVFEALRDWTYCGAPDLSECVFCCFCSGLETCLGTHPSETMEMIQVDRV